MGDVTTRVAEALDRADRLAALLGTFRHRFPREAAAAAAELDAAAPARTGPLHGLTLGVKDVIATREPAPVTCQSPVHDPHWWAGRDAPAIARLRAAGAVIVGRTTAAEHALGRPDPALALPVPRNPWDPDRWPGGSSCGSANGLPAGLFDVGIGTDSNGSLRVPAALCGVTALKPTFGLVPTDGSHPLSSSLDVIGPLAGTARDCADALAVMAGREPADTLWRTDGLHGVRIGVPARALEESGQLTDDCRAAFDRARHDLRSAGAQLVDIELPEVNELFAAQFLTLLAEGYEHHGAGLRARWGDYGRPFRRTLVLGGLVTADTRHHAARVRAACTESLRGRMAGLDAIATPTWPGTAPRYDDADALSAVSWLPGIWNAVGFPAVAVPMGHGSDGLPLSLQLAGAPGTDFALAAVADAYQQHTGLHLRRPDDTVLRPYLDLYGDAYGDAYGDVAPPHTPGTPTPTPTPAAGGPRLAPVAEPVSGASVAPEKVRQLADALHGLGLRIDDAEVAALSGLADLVSVLPAFLPEPPTDHRPL